MRKKITRETIAKEVLQKMQTEVGVLLEKYIIENSEKNQMKLKNLQNRLNETGGSGHLLLSKILPKRVKFYVNGSFQNVSFLTPLIGATDYILVYDCTTQKMRIEEQPVASVLVF